VNNGRKIKTDFSITIIHHHEPKQILSLNHIQIILLKMVTKFNPCKFKMTNINLNLMLEYHICPFKAILYSKCMQIKIHNHKITLHSLNNNNKILMIYTILALSNNNNNNNQYLILDCLAKNLTKIMDCSSNNNNLHNNNLFHMVILNNSNSHKNLHCILIFLKIPLFRNKCTRILP